MRKVFVMSIAMSVTRGLTGQCLMVMRGGKAVPGLPTSTVVRIPTLVAGGKPIPRCIKRVPCFRGTVVRRRLTSRGVLIRTVARKSCRGTLRTFALGGAVPSTVITGGILSSLVRTGGRC